jgi:SAM-dependent methyltransferase
MPHEIELLPSPAVHNRLYHLVGIVIMSLNQMRHRIRGYRNPRPQDAPHATDALRYDRAVVENWLSHLSHYQAGEVDLKGKDILELGPGPDLGTGLILLAKGARSYTAIDAHPLVHRTSAEQHRDLAMAIAASFDLDDAGRRELVELALRPSETDSRLRYVHLPRFDLETLEPDSYDLVFSHSSLEHVSRIKRTIEQVSRTARAGARFVAEIDLQTHTRWVRDHDPLNIYRYRSSLYQSLSFSGAPNRVRPDQYIQFLEANGWTNPRIYPRRVLDPKYVHAVEPSLAKRFRGDPERLGWMSVVQCATKKKLSRFSREKPREAEAGSA